ncbi:MAG: glycosyltransferase, partial [Coriobacteriia bacterium]|nr:glycosyltransferase [Coriobacteriia bacterium]
MRIGMALPNLPYPPDIRVDKEVEVLLAAGHEVVLLCRGDGILPAEEHVGGFTVVRHQTYPDSPVLRKLDSAIFLATMNSPSWRDAMISLVHRHKVQALHLHDLPYVPSLLTAARATGVPAVLDLHENYPAALAQWNRLRSSRIFFAPARAARLERRVLRLADRVIVGVDEAKERLV